MAAIRLVAILAAALALALLTPGGHVEARGSRKMHAGKGGHPEARANRGGRHGGEHHVAFDPLVAEADMRHEDEEWEDEYEREHHRRAHLHAGHHHEQSGSEDLTSEDAMAEEDAEHHEFLHDAGVDEDLHEDDELSHLNMEKRIDKLFPLIDVAPADGTIDLNELSAWELMQYEQMQEQRMQRELESLDGNGDGRVSLKEFMHDDTPGDKVKDWREFPEHDQDYYRQEMERFAVADDDGDGVLDKDQLYKVLHPEESSDPRMHAQMRKEELRNYDTNKNGLIEADEWMEGFWHIVHDYEADARQWQAKMAGKPYKVGHTGEEKRRDGKERFKDMDKDGDGALSADELEPVMYIMMPGEKHFADQTARHLVEQADDDGDLKLTMKEMKKHKHIFYELERSHEED